MMMRPSVTVRASYSGFPASLSTSKGFKLCAATAGLGLYLRHGSRGRAARGPARRPARERRRHRESVTAASHKPQALAPVLGLAIRALPCSRGSPGTLSLRTVTQHLQVAQLISGNIEANIPQYAIEY